MKQNILVFSCSLRKQSYNTVVAREIVSYSNDEVSFELIDFSTIPFYDQDDEAAFPQSVTDLKNKIKGASGIVIVTPEYNRSIPGYLKNMLDWTSRPYGDNAWTKKPVTVVGISIGQLGTALAQYHLKQVLLYLDAHLMGQPELYINDAGRKVSAEGMVTHEDTKKYIANFVEKTKEHVARFI